MSKQPDIPPELLSTATKLLISFSHAYNTTKAKKSKFASLTIPKISLYDYLCRICKLAELSEGALVVALIYLDKYIQARGSPITPFETHRLLSVSCMMAVKFLKDEYFDNEYYAKVAGVSLEEINDLEAEFLTTVEFKLFVTEEEFKECHKVLVQYSDTSTPTKPKEVPTKGLFDYMEVFKENKSENQAMADCKCM